MMIARLISALRLAGVPVSTAETLDAHRALMMVGYSQRQALKNALRLSCAKTLEDKRQFDICFERFMQFMPPPSLQSDDASTQNGEAQMVHQESETSKKDATDIARQMMEIARDIKLEEISLFTQRGLYIRRLLEGMGGNQDTPQTKQEEARAKALARQARFLVDRQLDMVEGQQAFKIRSDVLMDRDFGELDQRDLEIMAIQTKRLAKKLAQLSVKAGEARYSRTAGYGTQFEG